jgi:glycerol-3-phosphate dehydrogenase
VRQYGTLAKGAAGTTESRHFGADLHEAEVEYLVRREWAATGRGVLWRRTKLGLRLTAGEAADVDRHTRALAGERCAEAVE